MYAFTTGLPAMMALTIVLILGRTATTGMRLLTVMVPRAADVALQPFRRSTR
jgi:hypothetical protein